MQCAEATIGTGRPFNVPVQTDPRAALTADAVSPPSPAVVTVDMVDAGSGGVAAQVRDLLNKAGFLTQTSTTTNAYGVEGALIQMTRMLAIEWAEHDIRVNAIAPGRLETRSPSRAARTDDPAYMRAMLARIPLHRLATVDEVAAAVCYLASPQAGSITGQTLVLDGGITVA